MGESIYGRVRVVFRGSDCDPNFLDGRIRIRFFFSRGDIRINSTRSRAYHHNYHSIDCNDVVWHLYYAQLENYSWKPWFSFVFNTTERQY